MTEPEARASAGTDGWAKDREVKAEIVLLHTNGSWEARLLGNGAGCGVPGDDPHDALMKLCSRLQTEPMLQPILERLLQPLQDGFAEPMLQQAPLHDRSLSP